MKTGEQIIWELKSGLLENPKAGRRPKTLAESVPHVLFLCVALFSISLSCFGRENPQFEEPLVGRASQTTPDFPRIREQGAQSKAPAKTITPAQPEARAGKKKKFGARGAFVVAPLPISSPAIGSGILRVFGNIFPFSTKDKVSPHPLIGAAGLITNNGSRGFGIGGQLFVKENTYEITAGFVRGNVNYDISGNGIAANLQLPLTNLTSIGARLTRDTQPNNFYPIGGTFFSFTSDFFSQGLGSKYSFQADRTGFDKYWSLSMSQVLAYDANFCATGGNPPFYGNCIYGNNNELRGYTAGRYFTRYPLATKLEYRLVRSRTAALVGRFPAEANCCSWSRLATSCPAEGRIAI